MHDHLDSAPPAAGVGERAGPSPAAIRVVLILFFLSGATSLVYQVVWTRLLTLSFGSTSLAVATVLAAFMGGLALGAALFGRWADDFRAPARVYGWLELGIGLFAIATPVTLPALERLHDTIAPADGGFWVSALLRFAVATAFLLPPTALMGGTLPVIGRLFLDRGGAAAGTAMSRLYAINTSGAVVGCVLAGGVLLPFVGARWLCWACGLANLAIFAATRSLRIRPGKTPESSASESSATEPRTAAARGAAPPDSREALTRPFAASLAIAALAVSGLSGLLYEVAWSRVLTLVLGSSTYGFTLMLATFLLGIALGSAAAGWWLRRQVEPFISLGLFQLGVGVCALATAASFGLLPDAFVALFGELGAGFGTFLLAQALLVVVVMLPATLFLGASFPAACAVVVQDPRSGSRRVGVLYAWNTVGAILGSFLTGFVLMPLLGIRWTLVAGVVGNLMMALLLAAHALRAARARPRSSLLPRLTAIGAAGLLVVLAFVWRPPWDTLRMTSGPYAYAREYQTLSIDDRLARLEQLFYEEGPVATVAVVQEGDRRRLSVDGKTDAGTHRDMITQVLLGHLPLLYKPDAQRVLIIGYASGITAGAASRHPVARLDCVEIEPAMIPASEFFRQENHDIADDPRFHLTIDDGRALLRRGGPTYDVIISEPSNPWQAGSSRLFTREAFASAAARLAPGGVLAQWMHLYGVDLETFGLVTRTFLDVFPEVTLWVDHTVPEALFIATLVPQEWDLARVDELYRNRPEVRDSLCAVGYREPWGFLKAYRLGREELLELAGDGPLNRDDRPVLEFRAPRSLYTPNTVELHLREFARHRRPESFPRLVTSHSTENAALLDSWAEPLARAGAPETAVGALRVAIELGGETASRCTTLARARLAGGDVDGAYHAIERATVLDPDAADAFVLLGDVQYQRKEVEAAIAALQRAVELGADTPAVHNNLASAHSSRGDLDSALAELERALELDPGDRFARENRARLLEMRARDGGR